MQDGRCAKCGATEVYTDDAKLLEGGRRTVQLDRARFTIYICVACGYTESYLNAPDDRNLVREKWLRVEEPPSIGTTKLPPAEINGARVLFCGPLGQRVRPTGRHHIQMPDGSTYLPAGVAYAQRPGDAWIVRFYCDENWNVVTEQVYPDLDRAFTAVDQEYDGARVLLMQFPF